MKNINQILEKQCAHIEFKDGKVNYFSISTQHGIADTIEDAIKDIIEADKKYEGKSSLRYVAEKLEDSLPNKIDTEIDLSDLDLDKISKWYTDFVKRSFGYK